MTYLDLSLQSSEHVTYQGRLHPIVYARGGLLLAASLVGYAIEPVAQHFVSHLHLFPFQERPYVVVLLLVAVAGLLDLLGAWVKQQTTEIAITDKRVVYKQGFMDRHTIEMDADQIESVDVDQSILGRLLNYGTVTVRGTGSSIEPVAQIVDPLKFRQCLIRHPD